MSRHAFTPRMLPCPCGSGKRFKRCCGLLRRAYRGTTGIFEASADAQIRRLNSAIEHMRRGEGSKAEAVLKPLHADTVAASEIALVAGEICIDLLLLTEATAFLDRALVLDAENPEIRIARAECHRLAGRAQARRSAARGLREQLDRLQRRALAQPRQSGSGRHVHIVCKLDAIGGTERRALNLYRCLSCQVPVTLWSTVPVAAEAAAEAPVRLIGADAVPDGGMLALIGTYFECAGWLESSTFERVAICHNLAEQHANLGRLLARLETNMSRPRVEFVFPSRFFKNLTGLPGTVEYSAVDTEVFRPRRAREDSCRKLIVGRHGRAYPYKFHPNDPAFFRSLLGRGYGVRILGGSIVASMFDGDTAKPELLEVGMLDATEFLDGLDIFVYRKHPGFIETGGTVILEAMATGLPVVVFGGNCGCAELVINGENGFLVDDEAAANVCIDRLREDPALRARIGAAARASIVDLVRRQEADNVRFYLDRAVA
ncbi:MAG: glycosyltransferase [Rudaea sp.]